MNSLEIVQLNLELETKKEEYSLLIKSGGSYHKKYLKYKMKYLQLKKNN